MIDRCDIVCYILLSFYRLLISFLFVFLQRNLRLFDTSVVYCGLTVMWEFQREFSSFDRDSHGGLLWGSLGDMYALKSGEEYSEFFCEKCGF